MVPFVSIIIPTWRESSVVKRCVESLLASDYPEGKIEILLISHDPVSILTHARVRVLQVGKDVNYAESRNKGVEAASGEIIAFVDDDCTVPADWLSRAVRFFQERPEVSAIGGPAVPPPADSFRYRIGGYLFSSRFVVGQVAARYKKLKNSFETTGGHLILANTLVRRRAFEDVGGFDPKQVPCEEGYFCFRLRSRGYKLWYVPDIFVWHKAKPLFLPLLRKIFVYALGRGGLTARNPRTVKVPYIIPSLFVLSVLSLSLLSFAWIGFFYLFISVLGIYLASNFANALFLFFKFEKHPLVPLFAFVATPLIHFTYGLGVLYGMYVYLRGGFKGGTEMLNKIEVK